MNLLSNHVVSVLSVKSYVHKLFLFAAVMVAWALSGTASAEAIIEVVDDGSHVQVVSGPGTASIFDDSSIMTGIAVNTWRERYDFLAAGTHVLQAVDNTPELQLDVSGLGSAPVDVYLRHITASNSEWGIQAGLTSGSLTTYRYQDGTDLGDIGTVQHVEEVYLGQISDPSSGFSVFFDDATGVSTNDRAAFVGLRLAGAQAAAVPEPSTLIVFLLVGATCAVVLPFSRRLRSKDPQRS